MKKNIFLSLILLFSTFLYGQRVYNSAQPLFTDASPLSLILDESTFKTPVIQNTKDVLGPYIAAKTTQININQSNLTWHIINNKAVAEIEIFIADAKSINIELSNIQFPEKALLFLLANNESFGPYTSQNFTENKFSHFPISTNKLKLHFEINKEDISSINFKLNTINASFNESLLDGSCNIASVCPQANAYRKAQQSTVIISTNGVGFCTGTLVNNTTRDATPYILTAQHCLPLNNNVSNWTFAFNFEAQNCNQPDANNGQSFSLRGADVVAQNGTSDFALLKIRENINPTDPVYFAGWDKSDVSPESQFVFHHPNGALKRFSFNQNLAERTTYLENNAPPFVWKIDDWEQGTTEGGSSGSGLMSPSGLVIGTLVGGEASCNNISGSDFFGRLAIGFEPNNDQSKTLAPWLNPSNTLIDTLTGLKFPQSTKPKVDLAINAIKGFDTKSCDGVINPSVSIKNVGSDTVSNYALFISNATTPPWVTNESIQTLAPGEAFTFTFETRTYPAGSHIFDIVLNVDDDAYTDNNSGQLTSTVVKDAVNLKMDVTTDNFGSENTWIILDKDTNVVANGGPYNNDENGVLNTDIICLSEGCYTLEFTDSYGDGMCCEFGAGFFNLSVLNGKTLAMGYNGPTNDLGESEKQVVPFCIGPLSVNKIEAKTLNVYPNPSEAGAYIILDLDNIEAQSKIYTLEGKLVSTQFGPKINAPSHAGVYILKTNNFKAFKLIVY